MSVARIPERSVNLEQRLDLFLRMNTTGTPQSVKHLDHVRAMRNQLREARLLQDEATVSPTSKPPGLR